MSITVEVGLLSGRTATLKTSRQVVLEHIVIFVVLFVHS